ncbi:hypothetical protein DH2020_008572 [Rehmannia glutinosa]|uniref:Beta-glucosidase n=1 Tax=Rehmannia glutinosa TaxID=99300 RepID=A0ABR0X730_REHGL
MKNNKFRGIIVSNCLVLLLSAISTVKSSINEEQDNIKNRIFQMGFFLELPLLHIKYIEGAFLEDGSIADGTNGDIAVDHYHRYMEDIEIMHSLGLTSYRFSISWSRVLPRGRFGGVNQNGITFYNKIIDNLLLRGIEPFVTIFHNDYPQELEDRFGGWLSPLMQEEFVHFAETCFEKFGDRVKYWITINEPNIFSDMGYERAQYPPARCSPPFGNCAIGNSDVEPLIVSKVDGMLSISVHAFMYIPLRDDKNDEEAANRALAFNVAWTLDPLVFGDYPLEMKRYHGSELPKFSSEERALLRESIDFIGINHYGTLYAKDCIHSSCVCNDSSCTQGNDRPIRGFVQTTGQRNGVSIGYSSLVNEDDNNQINDVKRIHYHQSYLAYLAQAIRKGADVRGYFIWSLMDNFEWSSGYAIKFGIYHIDPPTLNRIPKMSAVWYKDFLGNSNLVDTTIFSNKKKEALSGIQSE